jgi:hypothetical protein
MSVSSTEGKDLETTEPGASVLKAGLVYCPPLTCLLDTKFKILQVHFYS